MEEKKVQRELHVVSTMKGMKTILEVQDLLHMLHTKIRRKKRLVVLVENQMYKIKIGAEGKIEWEPIEDKSFLNNEYTKLYIDEFKIFDNTRSEYDIAAERIEREFLEDK